MPLEMIPERSMIRVSGEDAAHFLNNLVTANVEKLNPGEAIFAALLSPQGKILFDFFVIGENNGFLIDISSQLADDFIRRLMFYRLRAKVDIALAEPGLSVVAAWGDHDEPAERPLIAFDDPRHRTGQAPLMGKRLYGRFPQIGSGNGYTALRISAAIAQGGIDFQYGDAFPHEVLMDQFGGVDFQKGCYVGQEVVSRMEHRSTARKRVLPVTAVSTLANALPDTGTPILADDTHIGTLGSVSGRNGLAMLRMDKVKRAVNQGVAVMAGDVAIEVYLPPWVDFGWPDDANSQ